MTDRIPRFSVLDHDWLDDVVDATNSYGCAVVHDAVAEPFLSTLRDALYHAREGVVRSIGVDRLQRAGELGVVRIPFLFDSAFFSLLEVPAILAIADAVVGNNSILHLMNGFVLPSIDEPMTPDVFQNSFHRDFPRYLNGYVASLNVLLAVDPFSVSTGATLVIPGSHQKVETPTTDECSSAIAAEAPAGSLVVFDSTLWHAAGKNTSGRDRLAINMQFTKSFFKQQIDYVRALGDTCIEKLPPRTQQLLGWYTRVVTSLDEYYVAEADRLYRRGQG